MPVTPLHLGPGVLIKSAATRHVSLTVFTLSQVTMDVEVLARLAMGAHTLHGFTNSFIGATVVLLITVPAGKPVCELFLRWWNRQLSEAQAKWLGVPSGIRWGAAWSGGILGVYSHVLLDAVMHHDAHPWAPFSASNPFIDLLSVGQLNLLCLLTLAAGVLLLAVTKVLGARARNRS